MSDLIERLRAEYRRLLPSARYDDKVAANLHGEAAAALEAEASEGERRGLERAIRFVENRKQQYIDEVGVYDYSTGVYEFPGTGDETVFEWEEIVDGLKALLTKGEAQ